MEKTKNDWVNTVESVFPEYKTNDRSRSPDELQKAIKLSILTQFYPPDYAATGQLIQELATHLGNLGMKVHIFTGQPGYAFNSSQAPAVEWSNSLLIRRSRTSQWLSQRIRGKAINGILFCLRSGLHILRSYWRGEVLLLTTAPAFLPIIGYIANLCFSVPYVCLIYDLYPDVAVELKVLPPRNWMVKLWDRVNRQVWQRSQAIIVMSSTMKDRITAKHPQVASKISIIHNWANVDSIKPIPKQENWFARKYGLVNRFTVMYSGNMGRCHDLDTIMTAARILKDKPIQFVFIGNGAKKKDCLKAVQDRNLHNCLFLPFQDKKNIPYSMTATDLALVSIDDGLEGIVAPSKLYGFLAAGRPIAAVCEPHSYLRELIGDAGCGQAFNNGDANGLADFILHLSSHPQQVSAMGKAGRNYCELHFTPEIIAKEYAHVLDSKLLAKQNLHSAESSHLEKK